MSLIQLLSRIASFPYAFIGVVVLLYLLVNGTATFGLQFAAYTNDLELYLVMLGAIGIFQYSARIPELQYGLGNVMVGFVPGFLISALALGNLDTTSVIHASSLSPLNIILQLVFYIFVVAFSEEMIFRGYLMTYLSERLVPLPWLWQGIAFGFFHYFAYSDLFGYKWYAIFTAMVFGIFMGLIVYYFQKAGYGAIGFGFAVGFHAGWDATLSTGLFYVGGIL